MLLLLIYKLKTLKCVDIDPSVSCDFVASGADNAQVMSDMMAHAKEAHADKVAGMSDDQVNEMMMPHIKEEVEAAM